MSINQKPKAFEMQNAECRMQNDSHGKNPWLFCFETQTIAFGTPRVAYQAVSSQDAKKRVLTFHFYPRRNGVRITPTP